MPPCRLPPRIGQQWNSSPRFLGGRGLRRGRGAGKPRYGQVHVCWAASEEEGRKTALEWFPNIALPGDLSQELAQPAHFEQAAELLGEDDMAEIVACGPDPEKHVEMIGRFTDAGFDHVYVHQIGPDQQGFLDFYASEVLPRLKRDQPR